MQVIYKVFKQILLLAFDFIQKEDKNENKLYFLIKLYKHNLKRTHKKVKKKKYIYQVNVKLI